MAPAVVRAIDLVAAAWPPEEEVSPEPVLFAVKQCPKVSAICARELRRSTPSTCKELERVLCTRVSGP